MAIGVDFGVAVGVTVAAGVAGGDAAATGDADEPDELVAAGEQAAATTRIAVSKAASLRDASIVSPQLAGFAVTVGAVVVVGVGGSVAPSTGEGDEYMTTRQDVSPDADTVIGPVPSVVNP